MPEQLLGDAFNLTINGDNAIVATGRRFTQNVDQRAIQAGDLGAMRDQLRKLSFDESDLEDLRQALQAEEIAPDGSLGDRVNAWIGMAVVKAKRGALKIGMETVPQLLTSMIENYYGWSGD